MSEKTTVTITTYAGKVHTHTGDTVITFVVDNLVEALKNGGGKLGCTVNYSGESIPPEHFAEIIGGLIHSTTKSHYKNPIEVACMLDAIADKLNEHSEEISRDIAENMDSLEIYKLIGEFLGESSGENHD